ncbi:hypothetical protein L3C95_33190 [Chitinophaga filiformis]|uniref:hypothetical protein n=1 Tax=Chitinophaga filiformis TaxID=104663 RepID=UPI001F2CD81C|nr:hypothetical protein [Chitinophaga filiformis]MCF6407790.1 hypothetical protein [Chitinophaga filiformis]
MKHTFPIIAGLLSAIVSGCSQQNSNNNQGTTAFPPPHIYYRSYENVNEEGGYADGTYCATVEYYYAATGTRSTYTLEVEVEDNELTVIHWPNGGWLDNTHFTPPDISDGSASFTSDRGVDYTVEIIGEEGDCGLSGYAEDEDNLLQQEEDEEEERQRLREEREEEEERVEEDRRERRQQQEEEEEERRREQEELERSEEEPQAF